MSKVSSFVKLRGTIYDTTFRVIGGQTFAGNKSSLDKVKVKDDPAFANTRKNNAEFKSAAAAGKLLRAVAKLFLGKHTDRKTGPSLITQGIAIVRQDTTNPWGERTVAVGIAAGPLKYLGFDFNHLAPFADICDLALSVAFDRVTGECVLSIPSYVPNQAIVRPLGVTGDIKYKLQYTVAEMDFAGNIKVVADLTEQDHDYDGTTQGAATLTAQVTPNTTAPLFAYVSICWLKEVSGFDVLLNNTTSNGMKIIAVDIP